MSDEFIINEFENGNVKVSENVIAAIAYTACLNIEGVVDFQTGLKEGALQAIGYKNQSKGIKVSMGDNSTVVDIYVSIEYGRNLVEVAKAIQEEVKDKIINMLDIDFIEVNVHIVGIQVVSE